MITIPGLYVPYARRHRSFFPAAKRYYYNRHLVISDPAGVVGFPGEGLAVSSPARPLLVEGQRPGDANVQVELAAVLGSGQGNEVAAGLVGYECWRDVCPGRGEGLSIGVRPPS
jgi:hypothetical protein